MKKLLILILALMMLVALIAACGDESEKTEATTTAATTEATTTEATTTTTKTTVATTTTEATTEATTTEATTTETTTTETTTPPVVVNVPEAYADIDFKDGTISDAKGQLSFTNKGATVGKASVIHDGNTYEADALTASSGKYVICKFNNISTSAAMKAWAESGFSVEAFYLMPNSGSVQGIVCGTQNGGWGLAEDKTGKPYFITGGGSKYNSGAYAKSASSTTELVHVLGVYDMANKKCSIYINGKLTQEVTIASNFVCGEGNTFNYFCLGDDIKTGLTGGDFPTSGMTMVDAKIYDSALTADDAANIYKAAVNSLK